MPFFVNDNCGNTSGFLTCNGVSTDTRNLRANSLFFCLKGENFDGNTFAKKAFEQGALLSYMMIYNTIQIIKMPS